MANQPALESFKDALKGIRIVRRQAARTARSLKNVVKWTEQMVKDAESELQNAEGASSGEVEACRNKLRSWESRYRFIREECEYWEEQSQYQIAISYCIAFEKFLLDYLVESLREKEKLEKFLLKRLHKKSKHWKRLKLSVTLSELLPDDDPGVYECVAGEFPSFQELVDKAYGKVGEVFDNSPFGSKFLGNRSIFPNNKKRQSALKDIYLLFAMRNKIVHRGGESDDRYHKYLKDKGCRVRIDPPILRNYSAERFPPSIEILRSKARDSDRGKLDEIADSLDSYARYIAQICKR